MNFENINFYFYTNKQYFNLLDISLNVLGLIETSNKICVSKIIVFYAI